MTYRNTSGNPEVLIKVLNACIPQLGNKHWVFYSAGTNVEFQIVVTDTRSGAVRSYQNALGNPAPPVQDTSAFACQ